MPVTPRSDLLKDLLVLGAAPRPGGQFLLDGTGEHRQFTPEDFTDEQRELMRTATQFSDREVAPRVKEIEEKAPGVLVGLLKRAGELGFLAIDVPEEYGGLGLSKTTSMLATETIRRVGSFSTTIGAHTGIGTLPLVFYGTEEQKQRYLPRLASGEWIAAYALTEAGSGSDALAAKATARRDGDTWVLNGVKQWITNGGFADLFTVFAQVVPDGGFSAFLVEAKTPGVSHGPEEHKLGIRGSSTTEVILQDARIPAGNLLGDVGRGHKIAFNILNVGRLKLGIGTIGASKLCLEIAARYSQERKQFGKSLSSFGLIRQKLGQMATRIFVGESMTYRASGLIDAADFTAKDHARVLEEYAIESSVLKIFGSECLDFCSDEALQIHGGYGFIEEFPIARIARDSRINRIFEGTNEINRLLIPSILFKRALKGELPLLAFVEKTMEQLRASTTPFHTSASSDVLAYEKRACDVAKRLVAWIAALVAEKHAMDLPEHQELLGPLADAIIGAYGMDSAVQRALQAVESNHPRTVRMLPMVRIYVHDTHESLLETARLLAAEICDDTELEARMAEISRFPERRPLRYFTEVDRVAAGVLEDEGFMK